MQLCSRTPCYELSVVLPKEPKWTASEEEPRPVLIPLPGAEKDPNRVIRLYAAESLGPDLRSMGPSGIPARWFARPEYFGHRHGSCWMRHVRWKLKSVMTHFTVPGAADQVSGLSVVAGYANGNYGFACVFRDEDASAAAASATRS